MSKSPFIIISSPSGGGKSTITKKILHTSRRFAKTISATTRPPRAGEVDGRDYYFLSKEQFQSYIKEDKFLEWEEVYEGLCYGTLNSEIENLAQHQKVGILVLDIHGALELKKRFKHKVLTLFLDIPGMEVLKERLQYRGTESPESIQKRLDRTAYELSFKDQFDVVIPNIQVAQTVEQCMEAIEAFLHKLNF